MSGDGDHDRTADTANGDPVRVRVRGIYTTALTRLFEDGDDTTVVQASPPIRERFDASLPAEPADASAWTTDDRQGIGVIGTRGGVRTVAERVGALGRDALAWREPVPRGAVYAGEVTETLGSGAVVTLTDATDGADGDDTLPVANRDSEGFLPYSATAAHVSEGDRLRVQVREASAPWTGGRPVLDTTVEVGGELLRLVRGGSGDVGTGGPELADLLSADAPDGWAPDWAPAADDADLDALGTALEAASDEATTLDAALADVSPPDEVAPACYWPGEGTVWVRFGRETRFGLDDERRAVTATMAGHHRVKAGTEAASAAVDFVEAVCPGSSTGDFPFDATTRQFGPNEGDSLGIEHGKPDGRSFSLGRGEVTRRDPDGTVVVEREMSGRGTYDALGVEQEVGDVAVTKLTEGKWWYPTVYRGADGEKRGTYVNICTPVDVDVVKHTDGTVERVDDDELDEAEAAGYIPSELAERARDVAGAVENAL